MPKNSKGRDVAEIIPDKCIGCQLCAGECPVDAITMEGGVARVDPEACVGCGRCFEVCPVNSVIFDKPRRKVTGIVQQARPLDEYRGVAVFIELRDGGAAEISWQLLAKARELADKLGAPVLGFLPGWGAEPVAEEAIAFGCDVVYLVDSPLLQRYLSKAYGRAVVQLCEQVKPEVLLLGATPLGRDLASVVATQLETGLTADCTGLDVDARERLLLMTRPAFGGNVMATIVCRNNRPQMSTVRPGVFRLPEKAAERHGEIRRVDLAPPQGALPQAIDFIPVTAAGGEDISRAPALVVVGRGACEEAHLPMFEELARLLGGTIACSRPVVESGLLPYLRQVGQTGKTVAPRLYIGIAVSGAVQHLVGMQGSEKVVAINTDRHAPLVQIADYALIGDYQRIVPKLIKSLEARVSTARDAGASGERGL